MQKLAFVRRRRHGVSFGDENGQTMIFVVVGLAVVLLAIVGFAVDYGNIWFRRQHAQSAADAVCTATVMDMLNNVSNGTTTQGGFTMDGSSFNCSSVASQAYAPCKYAVLNGYSGGGLVTNTESNSVDVSFPSTITGNPIPVCPNPIPPNMKVCIPPSALASNPFVTVTITSRLKATFFGLLTANNTVDVPAKASCGLVLASAPIPLLILDKSRANTMTSSGGGNIKIWGGPQRSIQVNSTSTSALDWNGNKLQIDLSQGGPLPLPPATVPTGSNFGVTGVQSNAPSTSTTTGCQAPPSGPDICLGTTGVYQPGVRPITDPFSSIQVPEVPTAIGSETTGVPSGTNGCPALPTTRTCSEFTPGYYASGINLGGKYAIFDPGIYYIVGGMNFGSNSCVRPADVQGDGSGGTFFYFADGNSINVPANGGCNTNTQTTATNFDAASGLPNYYPFGANCDATSPALPGNLAASPSISGSVLLAPCTAPSASLTTLCAPNCTKNGGMGYGDPFGPKNVAAGTGDPAGTSRGMLMMQNRGVALANNKMPSWQGGGSFLISGSIYFHQCGTGGTDVSGINCPASAYTTLLTFGGNATGSSYVLGDIVTDQLNIHGSSALYMDLSPNATYFIFKASLLQ